MEYIHYKNIADTNKILWLCGKPSQVTHYLVNRIKHKLAPHLFDKTGKIIDNMENVILLNRNTSVVQLDELFKEPPFIGDTYYLIGDYSDLDNPVKRKIVKLLENIPNHIIATLYISEYGHYRQLADNKTFNVGKAVYLFRLPRELYADYLRANLKGEITDKAVKLYLRRTDNYENFILYIDKLKEQIYPITPETVKKCIPDCSGYTMYDYLSTLITRNRKTVHMKALNDCLAVFKRKTYDEIMNNLEVMLTLKRLTLQGYILPYTIGEDLKYLEENHLLPEVLEKMNKYTIEKYLELTSTISLPELNLIYLCFLNTKPTTQNLYILTDLIYNRNETKQLLGSICNRKLRLD